MDYKIVAAKETSQSIGGGTVHGLDSLRLFALFLVTWQHAASVLGAYAEITWRGISPGQTGVAIFCGISGYLAFHVTPRSTRGWFFRRLLGIFPSYWVVTIFAFVIAITFGSNKPVTLGLFVSQMLGLGYLTHGWQLINVVSWFVSLILVCYTFSFIARVSGCPAVFWGLIAIFSVLLVTTRTEVDLSRHVLAFSLGALYAINMGRFYATTVTVVFIGVGVYFDAQMFYAGIALFVLDFAVRGWIWEPLWVKKMAAYSYEYFLVHGIFLVAASKYILSATFSVIFAVVAASIAAVALHYFDKYMQAFFKIDRVKFF